MPSSRASSASTRVPHGPEAGRVKQSQAELRFLSEAEFAAAAKLAGRDADVLRVTVGTGLRFSEIGALWVGDVDLEHRTLRVNKAWKRKGEDGQSETPSWLKKLFKPKHSMRDH
ncbi:tyrosine-type recombinase/integrase [Nocardioides sp.]|uniref:tyrosine-type recombinase/integrase n=1 Tax=Nocardioides sp. TaxID=35761 RepID=UPI0039E516F3